MNSFVVLFTVFACAFAQYRPQPSHGSGKSAGIVRQNSDISPDGAYQWSFETENGISAQEQGALKAVGNEAGTAAQGSYSYTSPEGIPIQVQYVSDELGFRPQGAHLPQAPPIPEPILRALKWIEAHPQKEQQYKPQRQF